MYSGSLNSIHLSSKQKLHPDDIVDVLKETTPFMNEARIGHYRKRILRNIDKLSDLVNYRDKSQSQFEAFSRKEGQKLQSVSLTEILFFCLDVRATSLGGFIKYAL